MTKQQMSPKWKPFLTLIPTRGAKLSTISELAGSCNSSLELFLISWTTSLSDLSHCQTQRAA